MTIEQWLPSELSQTIWKNKYQHENETLDQWFDRVSGGNSDIKELIQQKKFLFGGRILANRGLATKKKITYSNCYVLEGPEDNLESIFECGAKIARTFSYGGGVGIDISKLRPYGAAVNNAAKTTSGAISFMEFYSHITEIIGQSGRRGALMISISCEHPDIDKFIEIKTDLNKVTKANISVRMTDKFMRAVINKENVHTQFISDTGEIINKEINAQYIFYKLAEANYNFAEPGILYWDRVENYNLLSNHPNYQLVGVNPCAEEPLSDGNSCLLGSINLSEFVINEKFDYVEFGSAVYKAVVAMNEVLDEGANLHPLEIQRKIAADWRAIGLGIMGLGDALIKLKIRYGSENAISFIHTMGRIFANKALYASNQLAIQYGAFPKFNPNCTETEYFKHVIGEDPYGLTESIKKHGLRNGQLLTCAPTGSLAALLEIVSGAEPMFATSYTRRTESLHNKTVDYKVYTPIVKPFIDAGLDETTFPDYIVTAPQLVPLDRIKMQGALQQYIDAAISSTINLDESATIQDVYDIYIESWKYGLKGVTVYRSGCKRSAVLSTKEIPSENKFTSRPEKIDAELMRFKNGNENWIAFVGLVNNKPYEIFTGIDDSENFPIAKSIKSGFIHKIKDEFGSRYDFSYVDSYNYENRLGGLSRIFNSEYWNYAKLISGYLRNEMPLEKVLKIIDGLHFNVEAMNTWKAGVIRTLKQYVPDGIDYHEKCPDCGEQLQYTGGCVGCNCGYSKCG